MLSSTALFFVSVVHFFLKQTYQTIRLVTSTVPETSYSWFFYNKATKTFKRGSWTCSQNFHQGCQSRHNFASTNGTNDITTKIKTEGDFKLANQRARKNNNIDCQPISFGTSHQPISFGTFFGTYISLTNQNVQPKRNGKMSKQLISGTVEVTR